MSIREFVVECGRDPKNHAEVQFYMDHESTEAVEKVVRQFVKPEFLALLHVFEAANED